MRIHRHTFDLKHPSTAGSTARPIGSLSITHAVWDANAVHGVHARYCVSKLGTARANRVRPIGSLSTHSAWGADAEHGVHARYSVSKLDTARANRVRPIGSLSTTHAAWDANAAHGVHATYCVSKLGTAFGQAHPRSVSPPGRLPIAGIFHLETANEPRFGIKNPHYPSSDGKRRSPGSNGEPPRTPSQVLPLSPLTTLGSAPP